MSSSSRQGAMSRHPALNRMPRDFLKWSAPLHPKFQRILKGTER